MEAQQHSNRITMATLRRRIHSGTLRRATTLKLKPEAETPAVDIDAGINSRVQSRR
jgi:hypothetical protein